MKNNTICGSCGKHFNSDYEFIVYGNNFASVDLKKGIEYICINCVYIYENAKEDDNGLDTGLDSRAATDK